MNEPREPEHLLFVCRQNIMRSRTAETVIGTTAKYQSRSAGFSKHAKVRIDESLIQWADRIFVMEEKHKRLILLAFPGAAHKEIIVLDIEDTYYYMEPELIDLIKARVLPLLT
jgi:predicted protein tyrosine phosphatase